MKSISIWAKNNRTHAIFFIIILKLLIAAAAVYTGILFTRTGINLSSGWLYIAVALFIATALIYERYSTRYYSRKMMDFLLVAFTFLATLVFTNTLDAVHFTNTTAASSVTPIKTKPTAKEILASLEHGDKKTLTKQEKRILKQEFKVQTKKLIRAKLNGDKESGKASVAIILTIIGALGLMALLTMLVCNLSCSGAEGAALAIFIVGMTGIIWGMVLLFKHIKRKRISRSSKQNE